MARWPTLNQKLATFQMIGYEPFQEQFVVHSSNRKVVQVVGAEGGGKSWVAANELTSCVPWCKLIYLIGETYDNPRKEFEYLRDNLIKLGALGVADTSQPKVGEWRLVTKTGCIIKTLSVREGASAIIATGEQPDIFCLCEAGIISSYSVFTASFRRATRSQGKVLLVGTLNDSFGWYAALVDELLIPNNLWDGETFSLPAWSNLALYPGGKNDPAIKMLEATLPEEEFLRTVAAKRVPSKALVFPEFSYTKHVRDCPFDVSLPVTIWIDPGYFPSAYVVLAVQFHGPEAWIIDEVYLNHHTHTQVIDICKNKAWWEKVTRGVIDFAGRQHHAEQSATEVWLHYGGLRCHSQQIGILDGISRHRSFLSPTPRLFHDVSCKHTLTEYQQYKRPTDRDGNATDDLPVDKNNHAMKAIAYGLIDRYGVVENKPQLTGMLAQAVVKGWH